MNEEEKKKYHKEYYEINKEKRKKYFKEYHIKKSPFSQETTNNSLFIFNNLKTKKEKVLNEEEKENINQFKLGNYENLTINIRRFKKILGKEEYKKLNENLLRKNLYYKKIKIRNELKAEREKINKEKRKKKNKEYYQKNRKELLKKAKTRYALNKKKRLLLK